MSGVFGAPFWGSGACWGSGAREWPALHGRARAELVVVGGSFAGLSAAWTLRAAGREVLLLEAGRVGAAAARAAGILTASAEHDLRDQVALHGEERALALWALGAAGVERAAELAIALPEAAFARPGSLYLARPGDEALLAEEAALRGRCGLTVSLEDRPRNPLARDGCRRALRAPQDATCDPHGLARGLAGALSAAGLRLHAHSPALRIDPATRRVLTPAGEVEAGQVLLAGVRVPGAPRARRLLPDAVSIATFCLVSEPLAPARVAALGLTGGESFWDTALPFFYGRLTPDRRLLVGGADLWGPLARGPLVPRALARLEREARRRLPLEGLGIAARWGGLVRVAPDALPRLGGVPGCASVDLAAGIGQALLGGQVLAERALGRDPPAAALLRADRPTGWGERLRSPRDSLRLFASLWRP